MSTNDGHDSHLQDLIKSGFLSQLVVRERVSSSHTTVTQDTKHSYCLVIRVKDTPASKRHNMAKRPAEESLEDTAHSNSPSTKKSRVRFNSADEIVSPNRSKLSSLLSTSANGHNQSGDSGKNGHTTYNTANSDDRGLGNIGETLGSSDLEEDERAFSAPSRQAAPLEGYADLYLDTINRSVLDFDFEKLCSVTLSNINVYACLVCGKYFQGRGPNSHAYFHALEVGHHVYVNMQTKKVYVLPEGYEVKSKSLEDIKFVVDPRLSKEEVAKLDKEGKDASDLVGKKYRPGMSRSNGYRGS